MSAVSHPDGIEIGIRCGIEERKGSTSFTIHHQISSPQPSWTPAINDITTFLIGRRARRHVRGDTPMASTPCVALFCPYSHTRVIRPNGSGYLPCFEMRDV